MKLLPVTLLLAIAIGVIYGVLFSRNYPLVDIYLGLVSIFGLLGLLTAILAVGGWKWLTGGNRPNNDQDKPKAPE